MEVGARRRVSPSSKGDVAVCSAGQRCAAVLHGVDNSVLRVHRLPVASEQGRSAHLRHGTTLLLNR